MLLGRYILNEHREAVLCPDADAWLMWMATHDRVVAKTEIGQKLLSTVFLAINHQWGDGPPLLFETIFFNEEAECLEMQRYSTWAEAELGHMEWTEKLLERSET